MKNYFILYDVINENKFENNNNVLSVLNLKISQLVVNNQIDETNLLICVNFQYSVICSVWVFLFDLISVEQTE